MAQRERERRKKKALALAGEAAAYPKVPGGWLVGVAAAVLGFVLYVNTFGHQYTLDDYSTIKGNWIVKSGLNAESVKLILTTEYRYGAWNSPGSLYRPVPLLMFAAEWQLAPDDPRLGHVVNALLYALTGWLLWVTLRRVLAKQPPALVAAAVLLFIAHPVHTEVVANTKSRDEILSLLFGTATLYAVWRHLDKGNARWLAAAVLFYALALFSKESAITLLAVVPLTIWFFRDERPARIVRVGLLLLIPAFAYLVVRKSVLDAQPYPEVYSALDTVYVAAKDRLEQLSTAFKMSGRYLKTLVYPHPLVSDMGYPQVKPVGFGDWRALAGLGVYGGLFGWAIAGLRAKRFESYAILFYLITFSLFSNIFLIIGTSYGERLLYLPSLGFVMLLAWGFSKLARIDDMRSLWDPNGRGAFFWGAIAVVVALYAYQTVARNPDWYVSGDLYAADLPKSPNSAKLNHHHGIEILKKGVKEDSGEVTDTLWVKRAIVAQTRAIELFPEYPDAFAARGLCWLRLAKYDKAEKDLRTALVYRHNNAEAWSNLGFVQYHTNRLGEAEESFKKSIAYDPRFVDARRNLGTVYAVTGRFPEAIEQWKEGLKYDPDNGTLLFFIGSAYRDMGKEHLARPWLQRAKAQGMGG